VPRLELAARLAPLVAGAGPATLEELSGLRKRSLLTPRISPPKLEACQGGFWPLYPSLSQRPASL
jgi:hypothetical protein